MSGDPALAPQAKAESILDKLLRILAGLTAVVVALAGLFAALPKLSIPWVQKTDPRELEFSRRLDLISGANPCPFNSFDAYIVDFSGLIDISTDYVDYLRENPEGDRKGVIASKLRVTLKTITERDGTKTSEYDKSDWHSVKLPDRFGKILDRINTMRQARSASTDWSVAQAEIKNWLVQSGFPSNPIERKQCRDPNQ